MCRDRDSDTEVTLCPEEGASWSPHCGQDIPSPLTMCSCFLISFLILLKCSSDHCDVRDV